MWITKYLSYIWLFKREKKYLCFLKNKLLLKSKPKSKPKSKLKLGFYYLIKLLLLVYQNILIIVMSF